MTKTELDTAVELAKTIVRDAMQTMYDALNQGQQKKLLKEQAVKEQFDLYGVEYSE
jgi:hypothetical protein